MQTQVYRSENDGSERIELRYLNSDGTRIVVVTRWLDRQMHPPKWRSKNRTRKLTAGEIRYFEERRES